MDEWTNGQEDKISKITPKHAAYAYAYNLVINDPLFSCKRPAKTNELLLRKVLLMDEWTQTGCE